MKQFKETAEHFTLHASACGACFNSGKASTIPKVTPVERLSALQDAFYARNLPKPRPKSGTV